jgi:2-amino-4-hydroxy-6-hydroxymethyldihydropteridine diphosphokinase
VILIALGANLPGHHGGPEETLVATRDNLIARGLNVVAFSSIWMTAPVPVSDQPWYRNAMLAVETDMGAQVLMELLHEVEQDFGRVRDPNNRNAARVLDLDIVAYNSNVLNQDKLTVPHPRMSERAFVLYPLQEIAPDWLHPVSKCSVSELIADLPAGQEILRSEDAAA